MYYNPYLQQPQYIPQQIQQQQQPMLNGKIVDGIDVVRGQDVPINSYGIFPTADLNNIFIKSWQPDGSTRIDTYNKVEKSNTPDINETLTDIYDMLNDLTKKVDALSKQPTSQKRKTTKEVEINE